MAHARGDGSKTVGQGREGRDLPRGREIRMKVLVLGGGQVATAVIEAAAQDYEIIAYPRAKLDIADGAAVAEALGAIKPNWIINAAAYTAVDRAEDEPKLAQAVNDTAVASLAQGAMRHGGRLLHISTDFVFDGKS